MELKNIFFLISKLIWILKIWDKKREIEKNNMCLCLCVCVCVCVRERERVSRDRKLSRTENLSKASPVGYAMSRDLKFYKYVLSITSLNNPQLFQFWEFFSVITLSVKLIRPWVFTLINSRIAHLMAYMQNANYFSQHINHGLFQWKEVQLHFRACHKSVLFQG